MFRPLLVLPICLGLGHAVAAPGALDFQRDVRPILSNHCFQCHGPDEEAREADLRLDKRESAVPTVIVPGKPDTSELVKRIFTDNEDDVMPPLSAKKPITEAQKEVLKRWIAEGAVYTKHWAFTKPERPQVPAIKDTAARIFNPIDAFIAARLDKEGLKQSPPADAHALARRVALDLTGLLPTPAELAAFVQNPSPQAYEAYVDQLLKSPHYGERWARRWLDLARYADTNGYEKDRERSIWPYRDWVIAALNADMPFDQFTIEQLAGDMLPNATPQQIVATGFHRNTMLNEEGGIDPLEFRYHAMTDRVATTGATWLGLTTGCAQCHTHKFDPITHTEYYGMMAFLNNTDEPDFDLPNADKEAARQANLKRAAALTTDLTAKQRVPEKAAFQSWLAEQRTKAVTWMPLRPATVKTNLPLLTVQDDGSLLGSGDITKSDRYDLTFPLSGQGITALRLEALPHESLPAHGPGMCYYEGPKGDFFMGEFQVFADGQPVKIANASESYSKNNFGKSPVSAKAATDGDPQTGWSCAGRYGERHEAVFVFAKPVTAKTLTITMLFGRHYACPLGHFRISTTSVAKGISARDMDASLAELLVLPEAKLSPFQRDQLFTHYLLTSKKFAKESQAIKDLRKPTETTTTLVMRERPAVNPRLTYRHHRGEYTQPKEAVQPVTLAILHPFPKDAPRNRLGFARWLVSPENPLTPRVIANRQWAAFFGRGLTKTLEDFGYQGAPPSHPELLDFLASNFVRQGWSLKKLHKLIVMSATYQQSSTVPADATARDPENIYLSHSPRVRLDAELVRDSVLRSSGLLSPQMGGASVYPPQPDSVTEVAYGKFKWTPSIGANRYRRSLYTFSKRTAPFAMFTTFDGPTGEACLAKRETSNTPLQALTSLNDIIVTEAAQAMGKQFAVGPPDDAKRIDDLYVRVLCRAP
ncbi:MAG: PSD1 and planctomycete cytochrome C domain-containing protein, partial [Prosthecobacter sp.]|nr:PSD1 and planctomycete cytochrome C domain-containing protein [Prosthecobacter sp.]